MRPGATIPRVLPVVNRCSPFHQPMLLSKARNLYRDSTRDRRTVLPPERPSVDHPSKKARKTLSASGVADEFATGVLL